MTKFVRNVLIQLSSLGMDEQSNKTATQMNARTSNEQPDEQTDSTYFSELLMKAKMIRLPQKICHSRQGLSELTR